MGILNNISNGLEQIAKATFVSASLKSQPTDAAKLELKDVKKRVLNYKPKAISTTRQDVKDWKNALASLDAEEPKNYPIQIMWQRAMDDGLLSSQIDNRKTEMFGIDWYLKTAAGEIDEDQTKKIKDSTFWRDITTAMLDAYYLQYSLVELSMGKTVDGEDTISIEVIPRTHVVPQLGRFFPDYTEEDKFIEYRKMKEFGVYLLEFNSNKRGHINKAVKHVLMKDFAQSCWAELCEIYGIPPRFMKTNTQDTAMLNRAEKMMSDMGAAAWFIIDETEEFEFAQGVTSNGDVYNGLISLCNNEMSMLISGAIIGQDTKNGTRSKDEAAQEMLKKLVLQDMVTCQDYWNRIVIPALKKIGYINGDVKFHYSIPEDLSDLWKRVVDTLPHFDIDPEWMKTKFGIEIIGKKEAKSTNLSFLPDSLFL